MIGQGLFEALVDQRQEASTVYGPLDRWLTRGQPAL